MPPKTLSLLKEEKSVPFQPYNILDTMEAREFDELTALASAICQTPVAMISLIEQDKLDIKSALGLAPDETPENYVKYVETIAFSDDLVIVDDDPVVFYAGIPLINADGETMGSLCVIDTQKRSLTDLQTAALKILAGQVMVRLELKRQAIELKKAHQALQEANIFTQKFAAMAAHDIKNPLSAISLTSQALKLRLEKLQDESGLKLVDININGIRKLVVLLDEMLAYSKNPTLLKQKKQLVSLSDVLKSVINMIKVPENIEFNLPVESPRIEASFVALEQIFINLFTNAIRYNDKEQGKIAVRFLSDNDNYYFEVEDNGIGIAEEYHQKVFTDNFTLRITDRYNQKGTGIGLSTVNELIKALSGSITLKSVLGSGTTFFISIPR